MDAPYLSNLSMKEFYTFVDDWQSYRARGGLRPVKALVSSAVLRLISLRVRADGGEDAGLDGDDDARFLQLVGRFFAPSSVHEAADRLRSLSMVARMPSVDCVLKLIQEYERVESALGTFRPPEAVVVRLFVDALRPPRLSERVALLMPKTLDDAKVHALREVQILAGVMQESARVSRSSEPRDRAMCSPDREHSRPVVVRVDGGAGDARTQRTEGDALKSSPVHKPRPALTCFSCGKEGHKQAACPERKPSWQREGPRLARKDVARMAVSPAPLGDGLIRHEVTLVTKAGELPVVALLDSGANRDFVSKAVYEQLLDMGVTVRRCTTTVEMLSGTAVTGLEVMCTMRVPPSRTVSRMTSVDVSLLVIEGATEQAVIGMPLMRSLGLTGLLLQDADQGSPAVVHDTIDEDRQLEQEAEVATPLPIVDDGPYQTELNAVLLEYADLYGELPRGGAAIPPMEIKLKEGEEPLSLPPRRLSPPLQQVVQTTVDEWLDAGIIRPSSSSYSSPIVIVPKKGGQYRVCVDYRSLNKATVDLKFPIQNTKALLERMTGHTVFGTIDLRAGFHQLPISEESQDLTAFSTPTGLYAFTRIQFGLKNGPAYFQQAMTREPASSVRATESAPAALEWRQVRAGCSQG